MAGDSLDILRRRIKMRADHRGMKEMDIILGRYAREAVDELNKEELVTLETFMEIDDQSLYAIVTGRIEVASHFLELVTAIRRINGLDTV